MSRSYNDMTGDTINVTRLLRLPAFASVPVASKPAGSLVYSTETDQIYLSTGTTWIPATSGASLPPALESIANLNTMANQMLYTIAGSTYAVSSISAYGRGFVASASAVAAQSYINLVPGVDVQAYSPKLDGLIAPTYASGSMIYATGASSFTTVPSQTYGRSVLNCADAAELTALVNVPATPGLTTLNAIARWGDATGTSLVNSGVSIDGLNNMTGIAGITASGTISGGTLSGITGSLSGNLTVSGNIDGITPAERSQLLNINATVISAAQWSYLGGMDQGVSTTSTPSFNGGAFTGILSLSGNRITNLASPTSANDATTKAYVDSQVGAGLRALASVMLATTTALPSNTYNSGTERLTATANGALSIDSVAVLVSDRVLIKNEATTINNGIYSVIQVGNGGAPYILERTSDFDVAASPIDKNAYVLVTSGATLISTGWLLTATVTVNVSPVIWEQYSSSQIYTAGAGLNLIANEFSVDTTARLTFAGNALDLTTPVAFADGGIGLDGTSLVALQLVRTNAGATALESSGLTVSATGVVVTTTGAQTLTNKILTAPSITAGALTGLTTIGAGSVITDASLTGGATTIDGATLTNCTITSATNAVRATSLATSGANVSISASAPPIAGDSLVATSATTAEWQTPATVFPARVISVGQTGADYTTIAAAIVAANALTPIATNPVTIRVAPGTYSENNPLTVPQYTSITTYGEMANSTIVTALNPGSNIFVLSLNSAIFGLIAQGATTATAFYSTAISTGTTALTRCQARNCLYGFQSVGTGAQFSNIMLCNTCSAVSTSLAAPFGSMIGFYSNNGGTMTCISSSASGFFVAANAFDIGFLSEGDYSLIIASANCNVNFANNGYIVRDGSAGAFAEMRLSASQCTNIGKTSAPYGAQLYVGNFATANVTALFMKDDFATYPFTYSIYGVSQPSPNQSTLFITGMDFKLSEINVDSNFILSGNALNETLGDVGIVNFGELSVGYPGKGAETVMGEGDSHTIGMYVYREDTLGVFTDITSSLEFPDSTNVDLFSGTAVGNRVYIGGTIQTFPGIAAQITTGMLPSQILTWEYWNGAAWTAFNVMKTNRTAPYLPLANTAFVTTGNFQLRFGTMTGWVANSVGGGGVGPTAAFWVRATVTTLLATIPQANQFKLHTNRVEVNADGFTEYFGVARAIKYFYIPLTELRSAYSGGTGATFATPDITVTVGSLTTNADYTMPRVDNAYDTVNRRSTVTFCIPPDMDTSFPLTLRIHWKHATVVGVATAFTWQVRYVLQTPGTAPGFLFAANSTNVTPGNTVGTVVTGTTTTAVPDVSTIYFTDVQIPIPTAIAWRSAGAGDHIWMSINRTAAGAGSTYILQLQPLYRSWTDGMYSF